MLLIAHKSKNSEYMKAQIAEMLSPENRYYAGQAIGHSPSTEEACMYYVLNGHSASFERRRINGEIAIKTSASF